MSDITYGLTANGFVAKDLQQCKNELESMFQGLFGQDVDLDPDGPIGQLVGGLAVREANMWELAQSVYSAFDPDSAEGVVQDKTAALTNVTRIEATATQVVEALFGSNGTVIPYLHIIKQSSTGQQFQLKGAVTINYTSLLSITLAIAAAVNAHDYLFTINSLSASYTANGSDTTTSIATALVAAINALITAGSLSNITVTDNGNGSLTIVATDGQTSFAIGNSDAEITTSAMASPGTYLATQTGAISAPASSVDTIVTPINGLSSVTNLSAGSTGTPVESDTAFRIRRPIAAQQGNATDVAIANAIQKNVPGVSYAVVASNRTDSVDADGRPPHSLEAIVIGGDDQLIADQIWLTAPAGIQFYGTTTKTVVDSTGRSQSVSFSRPIDQYIWITITGHYNTEETFPTNGVAAIQAAVAAWGSANHGVGKDVLFGRVVIPVYTVPGLKDISVTLAVTSSASPAPASGDYAATDVTITDQQIAIFATSQIIVSLS